MVYILRKALHPLNLSPRACNKMIDGFQLKLGFNKFSFKHRYEVFVKGLEEKYIVILCLYVEDILVINSNKIELKILAYFLGMEIVNTKHDVFLN